MPWRFRKVVQFGLLRGWLSRTGIGYSWGFPGFRIGVAADGRRYFSVGIPGTGFYFYKYLRPSQTGNVGAVPPVLGPSGGAAFHPSKSVVKSAKPASANPPQTNQSPWWKQKNLP
jgi:hypothetical protein